MLGHLQIQNDFDHRRRRPLPCCETKLRVILGERVEGGLVNVRASNFSSSDGIPQQENITRSGVAVGLVGGTMIAACLVYSCRHKGSKNKDGTSKELLSGCLNKLFVDTVDIVSQISTTPAVVTTRSHLPQSWGQVRRPRNPLTKPASLQERRNQSPLLLSLCSQIIVSTSE